MTPSQKTGLACGIFAYVFWGMTPIYFKQMAGAPALTVLSHRIVGATIILALLLQLLRQWPEFRSIFASRRLAAMMIASTVMIAVNWLVFIHCIQQEQVLQSALGYYLNPLFTAVLGMVFMGERFRPLQWLALGFAVVGIAVQLIGTQTLPGLALLLAVSFGFYGLLRKRAGVGAAPGLLFETMTLMPLALLYFAFTIRNDGTGSIIPGGGIMWLWLLLAGPITTLPLLAFNIAAKRLKLTTMGFLQYLGPSCQFAQALLFNETFHWPQAVMFGLIWIGIAIYCADSIMFTRRQRPATIPE